MVVKLDQIFKQFDRRTIIGNFTYTFESPHIYALFGHNGVGKSTLLQIIAGIYTPNKGHVSYIHDQKNIATDSIYQHISIAAPYLELIEEYTLPELLQFHFGLKPIISSASINDISTLLPYGESKQIKHYSSGMKQRLKLVLALFTQSDLLLLDEPTANFDEQGISWYKNLLQQYRNNRLTIIASAQRYDHDFCHEFIDLNVLSS